MTLFAKKGRNELLAKDNKLDVKDELFTLLKESKELNDKDKLHAYCSLFKASKIDKIARAIESLVISQT